MSTTPPASSSRARPPARRKPNTADDAPYIGPSINAGAKRQAGAPPNDGDPKKRRKDDVSSMRGPASTGMPIRRPELFMPSELPVSRVQFDTMSTTVLHRYLAMNDILPYVNPPPFAVVDPPPPYSLINPRHQHHAAANPPSTIYGMRQHRDPNLRRSIRLLEDEEMSRPPVLSDINEVHRMLASMVEYHFRQQSLSAIRSDIDILKPFMLAVERDQLREATIGRMDD